MKSKLMRSLRRFAIIRAIARGTKRIHLPGFAGLSLYEVSVFFFRGINRSGVQDRAASMAYSFFLALWPSILFLFTLIPFIPIQDFQATLFETIREIMPHNAFDAIEDTIAEIVKQPNKSLLSVGFLAALYFSTSGFMAMMGAFNKSIHVKERRKTWKQQLIALLLVFIVLVVLLITVGTVISSEFVIGYLIPEGSKRSILLNIGQWIVLALLVMTLIAVFYRFAPAKKLHRHFYSPGVLLATLLILLASGILAWYVNSFGSFNKIYGSIGSVIVMLLWFYYNSVMLLLGFELDASIMMAKANKRTLLEQEAVEIKKEEAQV